jgi:NAD(P)-dependent dehydrogenase (short-subunit alcohol dehydrogenase family)
MAKALMANGAKKVYILGRRQDVLDAAAKETAGLVPIQTDITSKDSLQAAVDKIAADEGYLNLLVANSGIVGTTRIWGTGNSVRSIKEMRQELFADNDFEDFTNAFRVNVAGSFFTLAAFLELLDEGNKRAAAGEGAFGGQAAPGVPFVQSQVIVTSSISAYVRGPTTPPSYGGSKAAILEMAKQASTQLAPHGIRVNIIAPGCKWFLSPSVAAFCRIFLCGTNIHPSVPIRDGGRLDR